MNPGPPAPKAGALSWLGYGPVDQLYKLLDPKLGRRRRLNKLHSTVPWSPFYTLLKACHLLEFTKILDIEMSYTIADRETL